MVFPTPPQCVSRDRSPYWIGLFDIDALKPGPLSERPWLSLQVRMKPRVSLVQIEPSLCAQDAKLRFTAAKMRGSAARNRRNCGGQRVYTENVGGSSPSSPTTEIRQFLDIGPDFTSGSVGSIEPRLLQNSSAELASRM